jgi:hypothetical protein
MFVRASLAVRRFAVGVSAAIAVSAAILAAAAWAATPKDGHYSGFVDPYTISFVVGHGKITELRTDFEATTCSGLAPSSLVHYFEFPALAIRNGRFTGSTTLHYASGLDPHFSLSGSFSSPTRAAGTFHEHIAVPASWGVPSCTISEAFSASRVK